MTQVILFGGGDGGGIIVTEHGIKKIPPFDPAIIAELSAVSKLAMAATEIKNTEAQRELNEVTSRLTAVVIPQITKVSGAISDVAGLVYCDPDGGFVCGSTGKHPPVPIGGTHAGMLTGAR